MHAFAQLSGRCCVQGELTVTLVDAQNIPVWGFPWQSNPYCRLTLGTQAVDSKRERETGGRGSFKNPTWNQEFQFLVEDGPNQVKPSCQPPPNPIARVVNHSAVICMSWTVCERARFAGMHASR